MYDFFDAVKATVDASAEFKGRGSTARFEGTMPTEYCQIASPFVNPEMFFKHTNNQLLTVENFCLPHILVWLPELSFGARLYPGARPKCKFHNCSSCVNIRGWVPDPRHCYGEDRWIALMGKVYECTVTGQTFRGYDKTVLDNSPYEVTLFWKRIGCTLSHRGAIANSLLQRLRSEVNQGMSVNGFQRMILENMKQCSFLSSAQ